MKGKWNPGTAAVLLFLVVLASAFAGTWKPDPMDYIVESCYDGINNDGDTDPLFGPFIDLDDTECIYMPFEVAGWASGEYDGRGFNAPLQGDIDVYVQQWNLSDLPVSTYDGAKALHVYFGSDVCQDSRVQDAIILYRDTYGLEAWKTGVYEHQNECGLSY